MTERYRKSADKLIKEEREEGTLRRKTNLRNLGCINYDALTGLHSYCQALISLYTDIRLKMRSEGIKSGKEVDEIKKIIKNAENCQYFVETLYREDLEMKGHELDSNIRYLWVSEDEYNEQVNEWKNYMFIRSYNTDRRDF